MLQGERILRAVKPLLSFKRFNHGESKTPKNAYIHPKSLIVPDDRMLPTDITQKRQMVKNILMALIELGESGLPSSIDTAFAWEKLDMCTNYQQVLYTFR